MKLVQKAESEMPDFTKENWKLIKTLTKGGFTYHFYYDATRPQLMVAAMKVGAMFLCEKTLTRLSWQVGDNIRTVRLEIDELVQENPVAVVKGKRYELDGIMDRLSQKSELKM